MKRVLDALQSYLRTVRVYGFDETEALQYARDILADGSTSADECSKVLLTAQQQIVTECERRSFGTEESDEVVLRKIKSDAEREPKEKASTVDRERFVREFLITSGLTTGAISWIIENVETDLLPHFVKILNHRIQTGEYKESINSARNNASKRWGFDDA